MKKLNASLQVTVAAFDKPLHDKSNVHLVLLSKDQRQKAIPLSYHKVKGVYTAENILPGTYLLEAEAGGYESQQRTVTINSGAHEEDFVLGKKGMPFYYRGKVKVPFEHDRSLVAVMLSRKNFAKYEGSVTETARKLGLSKEETSSHIIENGVLVFRAGKKDAQSEQAKEEIIRQLENTDGVKLAGPVVALDKNSVSYLTRQIIVKFKSEIVKDRIPAIAREFDCEVIRPITYLGNGWLFQTVKPASLRVLDICEQLVQSKMVEYAEPNMAFTVVNDFTPNDFLFPQQGHHAVINSAGAWDVTTGSNAIIISVVDGGFDLTHPDFQNVMGGGWNKVYSPFDFSGMDANPLGISHGVESSGIAAANGNNAEGISGLAPNCVLLPVQYPGATDLSFSDMYIWIAGFNPNSVTPGFPAAINPGADVISNSFGFYQAAISGIMKDTFDYLTTYGRNGKGCVVVYSVGNDNVNFNNGMGGSGRKWASYSRTIAVAASTISPPDPSEIKATTSNFGLNLDICAPAGNTGSQTRSISSYNVGAGSLAGTMGGASLDYGSFGQTSCACPQVSGTAALMLSVNPNLSWIEVRQILRDTAQKIDFANVDPTGNWVDLDGDLIKEYSQWYGYGRLNAAAAVTAASGFVSSSDVLVRDNLADTGTVPSAGVYWESPDVWVRTDDPVVDGALAIPADYMTAPPHLNADRSHDNWVYVRLKNTGASASNNFYVRVYIAHWAGTEFVFPNDFTPTNNPGDPIPHPMTPGTYLIGETLINSLPAATDQIINMKWDKANIPPDMVLVGGMNVHWHPCLLVQVTPFDGPAATGNHVWQNNNLAQRNISIVGVGVDDDDFSVGAVIGNENNSSNLIDVEIDRGNLPAGVQLYFYMADTRAMEWIEKQSRRNPVAAEGDSCELIFLEEAGVILACSDLKKRIPLHLAKNSKIKLDSCGEQGDDFGSYTIGKHEGKKVLLLESKTKVRIPVYRGGAKYLPVVIGGVIKSHPKKGDYEIIINQYDSKTERSGSYGIRLSF